MSELNIDTLQGLLANGSTVVSFTRVDGSVRKMRCTRDATLCPPGTYFEPLGSDVQVLPVFDLDVNEWRSFRVDSVMGLTIE